MEESDKNRIVRYLKDEITEQEKKELIDWINSSEENRLYFEEIADTWYSSGISDENTFNADKAWQQFYARHYIMSTRHSLRKVLKYAAVILLLVSIGWGGNFFFTTYWKAKPDKLMKLTVPKGETAHFKFADQTKVQLNAGSSIQFSKQFADGRREVFLEGEAYFQVSEDKNRPFIVHTDGLDIKVLGTSFNVKSYPEDKIIQTTLEEGKIQVSQISDSKRQKKKYILDKQQHLRYNKKMKDVQLKKNIDIRDYTGWKDGHYKFQGIQLNRLAKNIERLYNIDMQIEHPGLDSLTYTGSFYREESVSKILNMIELSSSQVKIEQTNNGKFIITKN